MSGEYEIFAATAPGLEAVLAEEVRAQGLGDPAMAGGGVTIAGGRAEVMRANLHLRTASRVLVRIGSFRAVHLAQLDRRARKFPWEEWLRPDVPVALEATCRRSRIWHEGAAAERVGRAISDRLGAPVRKGAPVRLLVRIEDDLCTLSLDTSGAPLHRRGTKQAVGKAPMRENLAAAFLRLCGFDGRMAVVDPMCGSGTFVTEAAEMAVGLAPGRARRFAFEAMAGFDPAAWEALKAEAAGPAHAVAEAARFFGSDRDQGVIGMARANAERAGVAGLCSFARLAISDARPPEGVAPGLVIANPPYGARIGNRGALGALYAAFGETIRAHFKGWRVGLVTSEPGLARASGLDFGPARVTVPHGGLRVGLYLSEPRG